MFGVTQNDQLSHLNQTLIMQTTCIKIWIGDYNSVCQYMIDAQVNTQKCSLLSPAEVNLKVSDLLQLQPEWYTTKVKTSDVLGKGALTSLPLHIILSSFISFVRQLCSTGHDKLSGYWPRKHCVLYFLIFVLNLPRISQLQIHLRITQLNEINWWVLL